MLLQMKKYMKKSGGKIKDVDTALRRDLAGFTFTKSTTIASETMPKNTADMSMTGTQHKLLKKLPKAVPMVKLLGATTSVSVEVPRGAHNFETCEGKGGHPSIFQ